MTLGFTRVSVCQNTCNQRTCRRDYRKHPYGRNNFREHDSEQVVGFLKQVPESQRGKASPNTDQHSQTGEKVLFRKVELQNQLADGKLDALVERS